MIQNMEKPMEVSGIAENFPRGVKLFKEVHVQKILSIDEKKTDIQSFLRTFAKVSVSHTKIIDMPRGISTEGQIITGKKMVIDGTIVQKIEYLQSAMILPVHVVYFNIPFSTYVILEEGMDDYLKFKVIPYIEDIYIQKIGEKKIFQSIFFTLQVTTF